MTHRSRIGGIAAALLTLTGCFAYRGPRGIEDSLERSLGVELKRDVGIKLGPVSTRFVASFASDDGDAELDFHDLTSVGVVVFERGAERERPVRRIAPRDLGLSGYETMLSASDGDDQVLILAKPHGDSIRELVLLAVDADEVVVARLTGHLDRLLARAMDEAKANGAHGLRGTVRF
jgi:uncharacterized protein DUF4252